MPISADAPDSLADSYVLVVDSDGTCTLNPRVPEMVGQKPWDWCVAEDCGECRENYVQACMFRQPIDRFETRMRYENRVFRLSMQLFPLENGQVLCTYHRVFEDALTQREKSVLSLIAGGADATQAAAALGISPSTVRDYIAGIKRKLNIQTQEGFSMAAHHFGLAGGSKTSG